MTDPIASCLAAAETDSAADEEEPHPTTDWSTAQTVRVSAAEDDDSENDHSLLTHTASGGGYDSLGSVSLVVDVRDNDAGVDGTMTVTAARTEIIEGEQVSFVVQLSPTVVSEDSFSVLELTQIGDYVAGACPCLYGAGNLSSSQVHAVVHTQDDDVQEADGSLTMRIVPGIPGYRAGSPATATVVVRDNDTPPTVELSMSPSSVDEDGGATTVTVTAELDGAARPAATAVTVAVGASGDSATEGTDYATVADLTVTIPSGSTSATGTFTLTPTDDSLGEGDETVSVTGTTTV